MSLTKISLPQDTDWRILKAQYQDAISDLGTIQTTNLNTVAKLEIAVYKLAEIQEKLLKGLKRKLTD